MSRFKPGRDTLTAPGDASSGSSRRPKFAPPVQKVSTSIVSSTGPLDTSSESLNSDPLAHSPARGFAFKCTLVFLYFRFSFVHEFISSAIHVDTHILIILAVLAYLSWFLAGDMFAAYSERLAWVWTAFVVWICLATVFSTWRGGSFNQVALPYVRTVLPLLLLIPTVVSSAADLKKILNVIGIAGSTAVIFGLLHRNDTGGRMDIGVSTGSIQDPNDFAAHLIFCLPAIAFTMFAKGRSIFVKLFGAGIVAAALFEIMSTGSRGGFVALLATAAFVALTGSNKIRLSILVGAPLLGMLALPFVNQKSLDRIVSVFDSSRASESAAASEQARRALLMDSLLATARNPIFGVGPGVFQEYQARLAGERNQKGMWHETHNGYTQLSSECGIPQLLIYLSAIAIMFKSLRRASKLRMPIIPEAARTMLVMLFGFSITLVFLAQAYRFTGLALGAIIVAMNRLIARHQAAA